MFRAFSALEVALVVTGIGAMLRELDSVVTTLGVLNVFVVDGTTSVVLVLVNALVVTVDVDRGIVAMDVVGDGVGIARVLVMIVVTGGSESVVVKVVRGGFNMVDVELDGSPEELGSVSRADVAEVLVFDAFVRVTVDVSVELGAVVESVTDADETKTSYYFLPYVDK